MPSSLIRSPSASRIAHVIKHAYLWREKWKWKKTYNGKATHHLSKRLYQNCTDHILHTAGCQCLLCKVGSWVAARIKTKRKEKERRKKKRKKKIVSESNSRARRLFIYFAFSICIAAAGKTGCIRRGAVERRRFAVQSFAAHPAQWFVLQRPVCEVR